MATVKDIFLKKSPCSFKTRKHFITQRVNEARPFAITIQSVNNLSGLPFEIITVKKANLHLAYYKSMDTTWFPGFKWTIGSCPQCLLHVGWYFESLIAQENRSFVAIAFNKISTKEND